MRGAGARLDWHEAGESDGGAEGEPGECKLGGRDAGAGRPEPLAADVDAEDREQGAVVEVGEVVHEREGQHEHRELRGGEREALQPRPHAAADREDALAEDDAACTARGGCSIGARGLPWRRLRAPCHLINLTFFGVFIGRGTPTIPGSDSTLGGTCAHTVARDHQR